MAEWWELHCRETIMAKKQTTTSKARKAKSFVLDPPKITVLSDSPLAAEDGVGDDFELPIRLAPMYDILRHPNTRTSLSIAIYGDWGTGKTSAMRWLERLLREWNNPKNKKLHGTGRCLHGSTTTKKTSGGG
jgi:hypothetical protein